MKLINKIIKFINNITDISKQFIKNNNFDIRNNNLTLEDTLLFRLKYTNINCSETKQKIVSSMNHNYNLKNNCCNDKYKRPSLYRKEERLPLAIYSNIHNNLLKFYGKLFNINDSIIIVDGVYSNTNTKHNGKVETSMSLGLFSLNSSTPYDIHFTGAGKKNNEKIKLQQYIESNLIYFKNKTIIC